MRNRDYKVQLYLVLHLLVLYTEENGGTVCYPIDESYDKNKQETRQKVDKRRPVANHIYNYERLVLQSKKLVHLLELISLLYLFTCKNVVLSHH